MVTKIAFLTSGGDAPGMNAAIRSITRMSLIKGCIPYAIFGGYQGLVDGGENIVEFNWERVAYIMSEGGTIIRSSRCEDFRTRNGKLKAAENLVRCGIDKLIVIGGDGSLTGADLFREQWDDLLEELATAGRISTSQRQHTKTLTVVGLVGSIDNDMFGTELTIGANSSLHRIIEAVDDISSTASSHSRAFIIEVMGRNCGWLAVNACLAIGADYLFIPENPPDIGWEEQMKVAVKRRWERRGKLSTIVIVCEGAVDRENRHISSDHVKKVLEECGLDSRVTTLGHIQRGGSPSAFDRYMATVQGVEAVKAVLDSDSSTSQSILIGMKENTVTRLPLVECVKTTKNISAKLREGLCSDALLLRGHEFQSSYEIVQSFYKLEEAQAEGRLGLGKKLRIAFVNCGAPCGGINAANRAIILYCLFKGYTPIGIFNGFSGLIKGDLKEMNIDDGPFHSEKGGSFLGINRSVPSENFSQVSFYLQKNQVDALIIIGGFEGYSAQRELLEHRNIYPSFEIPIVLIPATISNNVPGTDYSIGCDTALNIIVQSADSLKQSASSSRKRVFVVDVQGGRCGFLATMAGLACGASCTYIPEEGICLSKLTKDVKHLRQRFREDKYQGRIILRNETASEIYTAELLAKIFESESERLFDARWAILGHLQQGGSPSPLDRIRGNKLAVLSISFIEHTLKQDIEDTSSSLLFRSEFIEQHFTQMKKTEDAVVIGIRGPSVIFSSAKDLAHDTDRQNRRPKHPWWFEYTSLAKSLAKPEGI